MQTRNLFFVLLTLTLFLFTKKGFCEPTPVKDIPPGEDKIVAVREGEKVPFTGQLFEPATALRWANWLQQYKLRLASDVELTQKICEADKELERKKLEIEQEKNRTITDELRRTSAAKDARIVELQHQVNSPPFYRTFWFGATVGVVVTGALFGLGVWAASSSP